MKVETELEVNKELTSLYLDEHSIWIVLTRKTRTRTDTGGWTTDGTAVDLPPQRFAVIGPTAGLRRAPEVITEVGQVANYHLSLVGEIDADIKDNDTFFLGEDRYRVDFIFPEHTYKTHAVIVYEGGEPVV